ncbi:MAG TPA: hypothetical protein VF610_09505 [Segetibacter sp.]|jgi:hypothetical protein
MVASAKCGRTSFITFTQQPLHNYLMIMKIYSKAVIRYLPYRRYFDVITCNLTYYHRYEVPWQQAKHMDNDSLSLMQNKPMVVPREEGLRDIRIVEAVTNHLYGHLLFMARLR